jgi:hypothetical protein
MEPCTLLVETDYSNTALPLDDYFVECDGNLHAISRNRLVPPCHWLIPRWRVMETCMLLVETD